MTKLDKAKEIVKSCIEGARCGIFNTRNIAGDTLYTIYDEDGLTIDICKYCEYFEVFGLTDEEFDELKNYYYGLIEDCDERREEDA